jgi:hypothetical protein
VFLQRRELGAGQNAEGDDAGDEGLEERGAKEGAIAMWCQYECDGVVVAGLRCRYLSKWYVEGFLNDDSDMVAVF